MAGLQAFYNKSIIMKTDIEILWTWVSKRMSISRVSTQTWVPHNKNPCISAGIRHTSKIGFNCFLSTQAFLLDNRWPRQQGIKERCILVVHMLWNNGEQHFKVFICVQVVGFCSFYKTIDYCAGFCPVVGLYQNEVLPADRERATLVPGTIKNP